MRMEITCSYCQRSILLSANQPVRCLCGTAYTLQLTTNPTTASVLSVPGYGSFESQLPKLSSVPQAFQDAFEGEELSP
jgi:hypothetical protein